MIEKTAIRPVSFGKGQIRHYNFEYRIDVVINLLFVLLYWFAIPIRRINIFYDIFNICSIEFGLRDCISRSRGSLDITVTA